MRRLAVAATLVALLVPATASALPPANDAASQAAPVAPFTAENGTTSDLFGVADLGEATPDTGTPRCLGPTSFQRTAWFRVPAGPLQRLRLDAITAPGQPDEVAELAAFVQPAGTPAPTTLEPQACDGRETGSRDAGVDLMVPAGREVLVQVGLPAGSKASQVVLNVDADPLRQLAPPTGDDALDGVAIRRARVRTLVLRGATLTQEDPAQPACPGAGTVWRRQVVPQTGEQVAMTRGTGVAALTVFVGKRPTGSTAVACATATTSRTETLSVPFRARKGQVAWLRLGTDTLTAASARASFSGPCDQTPIAPLTRPTVTLGVPSGQARRKRALGLRLRLAGPCLSRARVTVKRGRRIVARRTYKQVVRGLVTLRVPRVKRAAVPRGRYRVSVAGRVPAGKRKTYGVSKTLRYR